MLSLIVPDRRIPEHHALRSVCMIVDRALVAHSNVRSSTQPSTPDDDGSRMKAAAPSVREVGAALWVLEH